MVEARWVLSTGAVLQILGVVQVVWQVYDVGRKLKEVGRPQKVELPQTVTFDPTDDIPRGMARAGGTVSIEDQWEDRAAEIAAVTQLNTAIDQVDALVRAVTGGKVWVRLVGPLAIAVGIVLATWPDWVAEAASWVVGRL